MRYRLREARKAHGGVYQSEGAVLLEAKDAAGAVWEVVLIQAGKSANNNEYPPDVLAAATPLFEGVRALSRSDEDHLKDREKSAKNIVGWFENVRYQSGKIIAQFNISEAAGWLKTMLKDAWDRGKKDLIGFSIVAEGRGRIKKTAGGLVRVVGSIDKVSSVDVVVNPAAGGRILKLVAAESGSNNNEEDFEMLKEMLKLLESNRPDLYKKIDPKNITEEEVEKLLTEAMEPPADGDDGHDAGAGNQTDNKEIAAMLAEARKLTDEAKADREKAREERQEAVKLAECGATLTTKLAESGLPEKALARIKKRFTGQIFEADKLDEEIKSEREYLAQITESGRITGLGQSRIDVGPGERQKIIRALDGFFFNEDLRENDVVVPRFKSFREAYIVITGDANLTGLLREAGQLQRFTEALTTSSWTEILGDSITRRMLAEYNSPGLSDWRKIVSDIVPINDFRSNRRMRMGGYGNLPVVAEAGNYTDLTSPSDEEATYAIGKYGGLETITMEMIANDDVGAIRRIPQRLGRTAVITLYRFIFDFIKDNPNTTYDATALFAAGHNNLGSAALSATSLLAAKIAMADQAGYGAATDILGLIPKHLLVPNELQDVAFRLTISGSSIGSAEGTPRYADTEPNIHSTYGLAVVVVPYWTDANDWTLVCNPSDCPTFEIGFFKGRENPELFVQDQPTQGSLFTADKIIYKIRHIYGGAVLDHRGMYKAVVA